MPLVLWVFGGGHRDISLNTSLMVALEEKSGDVTIHRVGIMNVCTKVHGQSESAD